jgi:O-antigen biosynthesis protein
MKKIFKHFQYLIQTSNHVIKEFGLLYFLNFGFLQLREQNLDLFRPRKESEFSTIPTNPKKLDYDLWKNEHDIKIEVKSNSLQKSQNPKINILMFYDELVLDTSESIKSILNQSYQNFHLKIFSKIPITLDNLESNSKIQIIISETSEFKKIISDLDSDFIFILNNSVILQKNALSNFTQYLLDDTSSDLIYSDEERIDHTLKIQPFLKPDWSKYLFLTTNYIGSCFIVRNSLLQKIEIDNKSFEIDFYELLLQISGLSENFKHIPLILFSKIISKKQQFLPLFQKSLQNYFDKKCISSKVNIINNTLKLFFNLTNTPKISIIIPTKDNVKMLSRCLRSIEYNTNYENYEIIIINNNSILDETLSYLDSLPYTVIDYNEKFNFSKLNNLAASKTNGDYILFLNDDVEALESEWLLEMISLCEQSDVGIVGPKLLHTDNTIQHAGMVHLKNGFYFHPFQNFPSNTKTNFGIVNSLRERSAVTGACMLIKRSLFEKIGGFDERFDVYYGDSDLCLNAQKFGFKVIYTPYAILKHDGSSKIRTISKIYIPVENHHDFIKKWPSLMKGDPYYNSNFLYNYNLDTTSISKSNLTTKQQ